MAEKKNSALVKAEKATSGDPVEKQTGEREETIRAIREKQKADERIARARAKKTKVERRAAIKAEEMRRKQAQKARAKAERETIKRNALAERERKKLEEERKRAAVKAERAAKAEEERRQREAAKAEKRRERQMKQRSKNKKKKENKGYGGWMAAVISLGVTVLVLSSVLAMNIFMPTASDKQLAAMYEKSYYDTVTYVGNLDSNLSKALATKDGEALQKYMVELAVQSELAENDINRLPLEDDAKFYTTKLINQIGDFAKYLNKKLIDGEELTESDLASLKQLYEANKQFKESLSRITYNMGEGYDFKKLEKDGNELLSGMEELQNMSAEYPELIYDGPFSDGQAKKEVKGLSGGEVSVEEARDVFVKVFNEYGITEIEDAGETSGLFDCYNFTAMSDGAQIFAQISKKGGHVVLFDYFKDCSAVNYDGEDLIPVGQAFLENLGLDNMKCVWASSSQAVTSLNFAYEQDGVIVYSDLIKLTVCQETGKVTGMEAAPYYMNHTERDIPAPAISSQTAAGRVSSSLDIVGTRMAYIPKSENTECLAYEFKAEMDGDTYYVYIDALTGRQVEMFKVIVTDDGTMLL